MRGTAAAALLLLLLPCLLPLHAAAASNGSCARRCGALTVQYPFGFSPGCEIQLGCEQASGTAWLGATARELGLLVTNVTARAVFLYLTPDCSRRLNASVTELFSRNYAPGPKNGLLVSSCSRADNNSCGGVPPATLLNSSSHCFRGANNNVADAENLSCVSPPSGKRFLNRSEIRELGSECTGLVSAASFWEWDAPAPTPTPALLLGVMELEWWMLGPCRCSHQANCTPVVTPTAEQGFRCECLEGFDGDGFADGTGCRRVKCNPSKYLAGECGRTIQIALLAAGLTISPAVGCKQALDGMRGWRAQRAINAQQVLPANGRCTCSAGGHFARSLPASDETAAMLSLLLCHLATSDIAGSQPFIKLALIESSTYGLYQ